MLLALVLRCTRPSVGGSRCAAVSTSSNLSTPQPSTSAPRGNVRTCSKATTSGEGRAVQAGGGRCRLAAWQRETVRRSHLGICAAICTALHSPDARGSAQKAPSLETQVRLRGWYGVLDGAGVLFSCRCGAQGRYRCAPGARQMQGRACLAHAAPHSITPKRAAILPALPCNSALPAVMMELRASKRSRQEADWVEEASADSESESGEAPEAEPGYSDDEDSSE